jgi:diguanylate cyclase (GGDEF)-like protein
MPMPTSILLVEDNADDVDIIRRLVRRSGADVRLDQVATGAEALELARVRAYDVALVDQQLPDTRGEQLIGQMKAAVPELPIVMLTRQGDERLAVEVMKAGAFDYLRKDDLDASVLHRTVRNAVDRARLLLEIQHANERLRDWAIRDGLTGLFNHRHFQELLRTEFARAGRYGQALACLMVDLDHFKQINDTYGHPFGDEVLKQVANTLVAEARKVDVVARYGGEEFVLVLPNTDLAGARIVAERICERVGQTPVSHDGVTVAVTLSVGVATSDDPRCTTENALVKQADAALYRAKRGGRNRVCVAAEGSGGPLSESLALAPVTTAVREYEGEVRRLFVTTLSGLLALSERARARERRPRGLARRRAPARRGPPRRDGASLAQTRPPHRRGAQPPAAALPQRRAGARGAAEPRPRARDRAPPPRKLGRYGLSRRPRGRAHSPARPDRGGLRCLGRADLVATVARPPFAARGDARAGRGAGSALRIQDGRRPLAGAPRG